MFILFDSIILTKLIDRRFKGLVAHFSAFEEWFLLKDKIDVIFGCKVWVRD